MGCFDTLIGPARCPECDHRWTAKIQTKELGEAMNSYHAWQEIWPGDCRSLETDVLTCESCSHAFEVTPSIVMGFLCPFDEDPPASYDPASLIPWLVRAVSANARRWIDECRIRRGVTCAIEAHISAVEGEEHPSTTSIRRSHVSQQGMVAPPEGASPDEVLRHLLSEIERMKTAW